MYKRYKNESLSKILLIDYHSSLTQWSSVLLFISWAAEGGNIFLKVSTILFSFQIHFLRVVGVFFKHRIFVIFLKISCFISCFHAFIFCRLAQLGLWNPLCWVSLDLTWRVVLSLGRHLLWLIFFFSPSVWKKYSPSGLVLDFWFLWFRKN